MSDTTNPTIPATTETAATAFIARQAMRNVLIEGTDPDAMLAVVPSSNGACDIVDLQKFAAQPRASQTRKVVFYDAASLIGYLEQRCNHHLGRLVYNPDQLTITCIEDDHTWQAKTAVVELRRTREWTDWTNSSGKTMDQAGFADFVEDHTPDFAKPSAADMLEIAQTFHAAESAKFTSGVRLSNGETRLTYEQEINATAGKSGQLDVPTTILLRLRPFEGAAPTDITARFRFRLSSGRLSLGYVLDRPHDVARAAFDQMSAQIVDALPDWLHTIGQAP